jgi:hypothetical protein
MNMRQSSNPELGTAFGTFLTAKPVIGRTPFRLNPPHTKAFAGNLGVILGSGDQNHAVTLVSIPGIAISDIEGIRHQSGYPISGHLFAQ